MSSASDSKKSGYMPFRIEVTRIPTSYSIRSYGRPPRLNLEQIWEQRERDEAERQKPRDKDLH